MYQRKQPDKLESLLDGGKKKWVRYDEGAQIFSLGVHTFMKIAKEAGAVYHIGHIVLVNLEKVDEYMEIFCDDPNY
ncbi:MAG: hypothetical protein HUJ70_04410 [Pseudobutyrivibrio sp.]|nr:hypothetical protein [Pseudobutyrivibrio sp.]MCF0186835.1 hypothetical protein [Bacteroidaceae bacterium]